MSTNKQNPLGKGYVQVYTGNGKGKTTAALGLAFRAMGSGLKTYIGQFMKGQKYSELDAVKKVPDFITIEQYGDVNFTYTKDPPDPENVKSARAGLGKARQAMLSGRYNIIILDEINTAHFFHLITLAEMLNLIKEKPDGVELVFTGRYAPKELIEAADLVTEMVEIKHYYKTGMISRKGIED
jgi:cob(I)alamin adenosyltransferase